MKKIIIFACSLILALSLTACNGNSVMQDGGNNNNSANSNNNSSSLGSSVASDINNAASDVTELIAKITGEEAKKIALDHAGLKENDVTQLDIDLDRDNGVLKYEVDFHHGDIEYDYDINAVTGEVISADKDRD